MISLAHCRNQKLALFGLGASGFSLARALAAAGADFVCGDDDAQKMHAARRAGFPVADLPATDLDGIDALILAPAIAHRPPDAHPLARRARAARIPLIGDLELFSCALAARHINIPVVAVTGSNGKSTTTALIGHILGEAGHTHRLGGNIGRPVFDLELCEGSRPVDALIIECSSFQIELAPGLAPDTGVLLNLSPDHLDRHRTMRAYGTIKRSLIEASRFAVVGVDDRHGRRFFARLAAPPAIHSPAIHSSAIHRPASDRPASDGQGADVPAAPRAVCAISGRRRLDRGIGIHAGALVERTICAGDNVVDITPSAALRGPHNLQNIAAACAVARRFGVPLAECGKSIARFAGLAHRLETIGRLGNVAFVNDSKATNAAACAGALTSFDKVYWIAGGQMKEGGISSLGAALTHVVHAFLIGEASDAFAETLAHHHVSHTKCGTLERAFEAACRAALGDARARPRESRAVILSPACASFDQFRNFAERGEAFRSLCARQIARACATRGAKRVQPH